MNCRRVVSAVALVGLFAIAGPGRSEIFLVVDDLVAAFADNAGGDYGPSRFLIDDQDRLASACCSALDAPRRELYVADFNMGVLVFSATGSGTVTPLRAITGPATGFVDAAGLAVDTVHDELYVADAGAHLVRVFPRTANGDVAASRTIGGSNSFGANGFPSLVFLDLVHDELYVSVRESGSHRVLVFDRTASGDAIPKRTLTGLGSPRGVVVDLARDELFVAEYDNRVIKVFSRTAEGAAAPLRTIVLPTGIGQPWELAITDDDELLVSLNVSGGRRMLGYPLTASGVAAPTRSLEPNPALLLGLSSGVVTTRAKQCSADRVVDGCLFYDGFEFGTICTAGWSATVGPSTPCPVCGDGAIEGTETCDDGDAADGNGCSKLCVVDHAWSCSGEPSTCTITCGDGRIAFGIEACDDGDAFGGDGCSAACAVEPGYTCSGEPSVCVSN
jgi:cysteine-rich repeat protein